MADALNKASDVCTTLSDNIKSLESKHNQSDFINTEYTINYLTNQINAYLGKSRDFKTSYDPNSAENRNAAATLTTISTVLMNEVNGKKQAVDAAIEYHEAREEMEERIEEAKWETILVTAVVVVASAVVVAALPVSGPLVAGVVGGVSSAVLKANDKAMELYIEDGDISGDEWTEVALEGGKGFAVGMITGTVSGIVGQGISGLTSGIPGMQSANITTNIGTHVVVGATSDVVEGIVDRTTEEILDQVIVVEDGKMSINTDIDMDEVGDKAVDLKEIGKDLAIGGFKGYIDVHEVDYSETMNSEYEKSVLEDMYKNGEIEATVDPDIDSIDKKGFKDYVKDYTIKEKSMKEPLTFDNINSPDDYSHQNYDTIMNVNEAIGKADKIIVDDVFKTHDEKRNEVMAESEKTK